MDNEPAIKVERITKTFMLPHKRVNSLKQLLIQRKIHSKKEMDKVLKDVSFKVQKGEFLGVIGRNGSGKSTLLKLLAGVYSPTSGEITVEGRLTPFIELGVGFNPELTGRENVFLNGSLLGFKRKQMQEMYKSIVEFAELGGHMDQKLKNYSSGMQVRLAFSIAIRAQSDILLIDEVLAVGDARFQKKCFSIFDELKQSGRTIVFVSHSMAQIKEYCDRVIVIESGKIVFMGNPIKAAKTYEKINNEERRKLEPVILKTKISYRKGTGVVKFSKTRLNKDKFKFGENLKFESNYKAKEPVDHLYYGLSIYKKDRAQSIYAISGEIKPKGSRLNIEVNNLVLNPGKYYVSVGLTNRLDNWKAPYDLLEKMIAFTVVIQNNGRANKPKMLGPVFMEAEVENEN